MLNKNGRKAWKKTTRKRWTKGKLGKLKGTGNSINTNGSRNDSLICLLNAQANKYISFWLSHAIQKRKKKNRKLQ